MEERRTHEERESRGENKGVGCNDEKVYYLRKGVLYWDLSGFLCVLGLKEHGGGRLQGKQSQQGQNVFMGTTARDVNRKQEPSSG